MVTKTIDDLYSKLESLEENMVRKEELDSYIETIEVLSNSKTIKMIRDSRNDILDEKIKKIESFDELIN